MMRYGIAIVLLLASTVLAEDAERAPEPTPAAQQEAEKLIKEVYKDDYNKRGPDERRTLAARLLEEGRNTKSEVASQYVLLREAREMATQLGDVETALQAVGELSKAFVVDPVEMKLKALNSLRTTARATEAQGVAAEATLTMVEEAMVAENFDAAAKGLELATGFATGAKNMQLVAMIQSRRSEIRAQQQAAMESKLAADKLKQDPKDAAANLAVGTYVALFKNDWDAALPMLALSGDPAWASPAKADIANPVELVEMMKVADGWWDLSMKQSGLKNRIMARAEFWYNIILPNADGLIRSKVEKRLEQISTSKPGNVAVISEETRKLIPTPTELLKLKEAAVALRAGNYQRQQDLFQMQSAIYQRLSNNVTLCSDADFFARCKADAQMRKVIADNGGQLINSPLISSFSTFASGSKSKEELGSRLIGFERHNQIEKSLDANNIDSIVYSTVRNFATSHQQFKTQALRLQLCAYLKTRGVKSTGLERYRSYVERTRSGGY